MTLQELIALYRADSLDSSGALASDGRDVLCSDGLLTIYANEAQDEACRRALLLRDEVSSLCTMEYEAGEPMVSLDARIVRVLRAFVSGHPVNVLSVQQMDDRMPSWRAPSSAQQPRVLVVGVAEGKGRIWPTPSASGVLQLAVQRLPLKPMRVLADKPEIRAEAHAALVSWMLYRAYSRMDTDLYNDAKAAVHLAKFEAEFGGKASVRNEHWQRAVDDMAPAPIA